MNIYSYANNASLACAISIDPLICFCLPPISSGQGVFVWSRDEWVKQCIGLQACVLIHKHKSADIVRTFPNMSGLATAEWLYDLVVLELQIQYLEP